LLVVYIIVLMMHGHTNIKFPKKSAYFSIIFQLNNEATSFKIGAL